MRRKRLGRGLLAFAFAVLLASAACASFSAEDAPPAPPLAEGGPPEAGPPSEAAPDVVAPDAAPKPCDPNSPFGKPIAYGVLAGAPTSYVGAWNTPEGVFVGAADDAGIGLRFAQRLQDGTVETPVPIAIAGDTFFGAASPTLSNDGLTLYFSAFAPDAGIRPVTGAERSLYRAHRESTANTAFTSAKLIPTLGVDVYTPTIRGTTLHYAGRDPEGLFDLYEATFSASSPTPSTDQPVTALNTVGGYETSAVMSADGRHIYFATSRSAQGTLGRQDVWMAVRTGTEEWTDPRPVPELNSAGFDLPTWLSDDECTMLLVTNRAQTNLDNTFWDIYVAQRPPRP